MNNLNARVIIGLFNTTLRELKKVSKNQVTEDVAKGIAESFLKQIKDNDIRAIFSDYIFENYTIPL